MKNCLDCGFLVEDETELCGHCIDERRTAEDLAAYDALGLGELGRSGGVAGATQRSTSSKAASASGGQGAVATIERPARVEMAPEALRYRNPKRSRRVAALTLVSVLLAAAVATLCGFGMRGEGPLADTMVQWGLAEPPAVDVPAQWYPVPDPGGGFTATMPAGAAAYSAPVSDVDPAMGMLNGQEVALGEAARIVVASTDLGRGEPALIAADSDSGMAEMIDAFAAASPFGIETTRRTARVGEGRAVDSVFVNEFSGTTTRVRFVLLGGHLYTLITEGSDSGQAELNEAHARLIDGFDPTL